MNKILQHQFIQFDQFGITDLEQSLTHSLKQTQELLQQIELNKDSSWILISQLDFSLYNLNLIYGVVKHLLSVNDSKDLRNLQEKFQPIITEFYTSLGQNKKLYQHYKNIQAKDSQALDVEQQKVICNELRNFYLSGISLTQEKQEQFKINEQKLDELATKFEQNLLDSTDEYSKYVTLNELSGIPDDIIIMYKEAAIKDNQPNLYKVSLHAPSYIPILQYCDNRKLREELYFHYTTRASELSNTNFDNTKIIKQILSLRQKKAELLEFKDFTELSLYNKMAENSNQVLQFLYDLANKSKPQAISELQELKTFAKQIDKIEELAAWDITYYSEKLRQNKYSYSSQELKQYFQLPNVLNGLFSLIKQLYTVEFAEVKNIPIWHQDVITYNVIQDKQIIAHLYLDLFARQGKQPGAWMNSAQDKYQYKSKQFKAQAYIICNFTPPINNKPSLLSFDDVETLFHEMGHALHHMLTQINHFAISGINGVEWDAVELPSQFMEYFVWDYQILKNLTQHIETNEILPKALYDKLIASRFFQTGLQTLRQLEFGVFDILLHLEKADEEINYLALLDKVRQEIAVTIPPQFNRFPNSFGHIFAGGYASGYYSYKWAELLAADVFSQFDGIEDTEYNKIGKKFLNCILANGGLKPTLENFKAFMGREPQINALLKYSGIQSLST